MFWVSNYSVDISNIENDQVELESLKNQVQINRKYVKRFFILSAIYSGL